MVFWEMNMIQEVLDFATEEWKINEKEGVGERVRSQLYNAVAYKVERKCVTLEDQLANSFVLTLEYGMQMINKR